MATHSTIRFRLSLGIIVATCSYAEAPVKVNDVTLTRKQVETLRFVARNVMPALPGDSEQQLETAAYATWWSLREGVISDWLFRKTNAHLFSLCTRAGREVLLEPLDPCERGQPWQVGLAAVQVHTPGAVAKAQAERVQTAIGHSWARSSKNAEDVLNEAARLTGVDEATRARIANLPAGPLRTSWLLRNPVIGFAVL